MFLHLFVSHSVHRGVSGSGSRGVPLGPWGVHLLVTSPLVTPPPGYTPIDTHTPRSHTSLITHPWSHPPDTNTP